MPSLKTKTDASLAAWRHVCANRALWYRSDVDTDICRLDTVADVYRSHTDCVMVRFTDGIVKPMTNVLGATESVAPSVYANVVGRFAYEMTV